MFVCPNYDYEYFDKLDEAYEIERSNFNEKYSNDYDYEYFDKLDEAYENEQYKLNEQYNNEDDDDDYY